MHYSGFSYRAYIIHTRRDVRHDHGLQRVVPDLAGAAEDHHARSRTGTPPDAALVALAGARSRHNTYMSVPLVWAMINRTPRTSRAATWASDETFAYVVFLR